MTWTRDPDVLQFVDAARRYCSLIESNPADLDRWLTRLLPALSRVYALAHPLQRIKIKGPARRNNDEGVDFAIPHRQWNVAYGRIGKRLRKVRFYWGYFDPSAPKDFKSLELHDLANDLSDVWRDLAEGLRAWNADPHRHAATIRCHWQEPLFSSHWGIHAVSALRALHPLALLWGIEGLSPTRSRKR